MEHDSGIPIFLKICSYFLNKTKWWKTKDLNKTLYKLIAEQPSKLSLCRQSYAAKIKILILPNSNLWKILLILIFYQSCNRDKSTISLKWRLWHHPWMRKRTWNLNISIHFCIIILQKQKVNQDSASSTLVKRLIRVPLAHGSNPRPHPPLMQLPPPFAMMLKLMLNSVSAIL